MKCSMCPGRMPHPKPIQMHKGEFTHDLLHLHHSTHYFKCFVSSVDLCRSIDREME